MGAAIAKPKGNHRAAQIEEENPLRMLEQLFAGRAPAEWRALYAEAFDWGPDIGREAVQD